MTSKDVEFYRTLSIALGATSASLLYLYLASRRSSAGENALSSKPGLASILESTDVSAAPLESMNMKYVLPGQALSHRDARGGIYKLRIASVDEEPGVAGQGTTVNCYFTRRGFKRSGDLHQVAQYDVLLTGRARLKVLDQEKGTEEVIDLRPNELVKIPAYRPHVFEFLEDTSMLEWWDGKFEAWYYGPYRKEIGEATTRLFGGS